MAWRLGYRFLLINLAAALTLGGFAGAIVFGFNLGWPSVAFLILAMGVQPPFCALYARSFPHGARLGQIAAYSLLTGAALLVQVMLLVGGRILLAPT